MAGLFLINDHGGFPHLMSDLHIRNRIIKESKKSNYNWLAPADELIRVCNNPMFNKTYAKEIKVAIVKCYTSLMQGDIPNSISYAYQVVGELKKYENDKEVQKAREDFIREYIYKGIFWVDLGNHHETLHEAKEKWVSAKMEELLSDKKRKPNFDELETEFSEFVKREKEEGRILHKGLDFKISEPAMLLDRLPNYSDNDTSVLQTGYEPINKPSDKTLIKIAHEINQVGVAKVKTSKNQK